MAFSQKRLKSFAPPLHLRRWQMNSVKSKPHRNSAICPRNLCQILGVQTQEVARALLAVEDHTQQYAVVLVVLNTALRFRSGEEHGFSRGVFRVIPDDAVAGLGVGLAYTVDEGG